MEYTPNITNTVTGLVKKTWNKPAFEIISKDIIQGGAALGAEGSSTVVGTGSHAHLTPEHS